MTDFTAPQFCIGFDGEADPIIWGDRDPANVVTLRSAKASQGIFRGKPLSGLDASPEFQALMRGEHKGSTKRGGDIAKTSACRATEAEQWAYGVELRIAGSKWRRQVRAPHYPAVEAYKGPYKTSEHIAHKAAHTRALGSPQRFKLHGDGEHSAEAKHGDAAALTEARYLDWLAQRPVADERIAA